jgi:cell division protein FtsQ
MRQVGGGADDEDDGPEGPAPRRRQKPPAARTRPRIQRPRRRGQPTTFLERWQQGLRNAMRWGAFWSVLIGALFLTVTIAGLFSGGHVSAAVASVQRGFDGMMADAGFTVDDIKVTGAVNTRDGNVTRLLNFRRGDLMLYVDVDEARARVESLPWVKSAQVRRIWPNRVQIKIEERRPIARWLHNDRHFVIDSDGRIIGVTHARGFIALPLVTGKGAPEAAASFVALVSTQPELKSRVKIAIRRGERRWDLQLANGVGVRLPEEGAEAALTELVNLDREQKIFARDILSIDLRFANRYVVKLPPGSPLIAKTVKASGGRDT